MKLFQNSKKFLFVINFVMISLQKERTEADKLFDFNDQKASVCNYDLVTIETV